MEARVNTAIGNSLPYSSHMLLKYGGRACRRKLAWSGESTRRDAGVKVRIWVAAHLARRTCRASWCCFQAFLHIPQFPRHTLRTSLAAEAFPVGPAVDAKMRGAGELLRKA